MRKIKLYIAMSLNGKIATTDGAVDWLELIPNPEKDDYGYEKIYASVDTTIQGNSTYQQIVSWGIEFPYKKTKNYVLTRQKDLKKNKDVEFVTENHAEFIRKLKQEKGGDIWLIGGGTVNTLLLNEGLIDEIQVFTMPIILPGGIALFEGVPQETLLTVTKTKKYPTGVIETHYNVG